MSKKHFLLMADIVGSRALDKREDFMGTFKELTQNVNSHFKQQIVSPLTITLGDEFQGIVLNAKTLFEVVFYLEEQLIEQGQPFQLRYSMVYGLIETPINPKIAYEMYGPGLTTARELLQSAKDNGQYYAVNLQESLTEKLSLCMHLYQSIKTAWKPTELSIVSAFIKYQDYKDLARIGLYKTRSGAWKKGKSLRIEDYRTVKALIFLILKNGRS